MAVTLKEISGWLDQLELVYDLEDDKIVFFSGDKSSPKMHILRAKEEGCIFEWCMCMIDAENDRVLTVKEHEHLTTLLTYLLQVNYQTKFGTWEYNPDEGEITLNVEIPLEDATMTFKQFERICSLTMGTDKYSDNIKKILETGEIPEDEEDKMMQMLKALLVMAEKELEAETEDGI